MSKSTLQQLCNDASDSVLGNGLKPHSGVTPLVAMRTESPVSSQSCRSVDADVWCKRALHFLTLCLSIRWKQTWNPCIAPLGLNRCGSSSPPDLNRTSSMSDTISSMLFDILYYKTPRYPDFTDMGHHAIGSTPPEQWEGKKEFKHSLRIFIWKIWLTR